MISHEQTQALERHNQVLKEAYACAGSLLKSDSKTVESDLQAIEDEDVRHMSELLLYSVDETKNILNRGKFNKSKAIKFNHALREIIKDFDDISATPLALLRRVAEFSYVTGTANKSDMKTLEEGLAEDFMGMWHEQAFENLLCYANINNENAEDFNDRRGVDSFVQVTIDEWTPVDVKSSINAIKYKMSDSDFNTLRTFGSKQDPSYSHPQIKVAHSNDRFFVAIDFGLRGELPLSVSAPDYRQFDKASAQQMADQLLSHLQSTPTERFVKTKSGFMPKKTARSIGATAL